MTEKMRSFGKRLKQRMTGQKPAPEPGIPITITSYSQPHVLQHRMKEERMTHDEEVIATLSPVRLESNFGKMVLYFCPVNKLDVTAILKPGDGESIPCEAVVEGLEVPKNMKPGLYNLKNVNLHSNGTIRVKSTKNTQWEAVRTHD
jgi:hypothetical protein